MELHLEKTCWVVLKMHPEEAIWLKDILSDESFSRKMESPEDIRVRRNFYALLERTDSMDFRQIGK